MTSSELQQARRVLGTIENALSSRRLRETIEMPLDNAAESFLQSVPQPASTKEFNKQLNDFIIAVYSVASQGKRQLPPSAAFAVALQALGDVFGLPGRRGYEFALLGVLQTGSQEMSNVLTTILDGLKQREKSRYVRWICARSLDSLEWRLKCVLVETILEIHRERTREELLAGDSARFAGELPELLAAYLESAQATAPPASWSAETGNTSLPLSWSNTKSTDGVRDSR